MATDESRRSIVEFLRVLADPIRLEILGFLKDNEMPASKIKKEISRSQSTTSKHLNMLTNNNLIYFNITGSSSYASCGAKITPFLLNPPFVIASIIMFISFE